MLLALLLTLLPAPLQEAAPEPVPAPAPERLLLHNGRIHLGDRDGTVVEALLAEDGWVRAVGTRETLLAGLGAEADAVRSIDLDGAVALPGLADAHVELEALGARLTEPDLSDCRDDAAIVARLRAVAETVPAGTWIRAWGWRAGRFDQGGPAPIAGLSDALNENPVVVLGAEGHVACANTLALERAKLAETLSGKARLSGGRVLRDEDGAPTGVLVEGAVALVTDAIQPLEREERVRRLRRAQAHLLARGTTCVHDFGATMESLAFYHELAAAGELHLRVIAYVRGDRGLSEDELKLLAADRDPFARVRVGGVSLRVDGALETRGAALVEPYSDAPGERGLLRLTEESMTELVHSAARHRLPPALIATGDRGVRVGLDLFERMKLVDDDFPKLRPRIEGAMLVSPRDWPRFPELGVVPSMQPARSLARVELLSERVGAGRLRGANAWERLASDVTHLAFGSAAPRGPASALAGLRAALSRADEVARREQDLLGGKLLDARAAVDGYTSGPAWASHEEELRGRLLPGYVADVTVLDRDPLTCAPDELLDASVLLTIVEGAPVDPGAR